MESKIGSEVLIPYVMSFGEYSIERANVLFDQLIQLDIIIGNFVKNIIEQIPSERLELDLKSLILNFLILSIKKDAPGLINAIGVDLMIILQQHDQLFIIIMNFYMQSLTDKDIEKINQFAKNKPFTMYEMLNSIRTKEPPLDDFIEKVFTRPKYISKIAENGLNAQNIKKQYEICSSCNEKPGEFQCGKCNLTRYCSKKCQISDWKRHKKICCKFLKKNNS